MFANQDHGGILLHKKEEFADEEHEKRVAW